MIGLVGEGDEILRPGFDPAVFIGRIERLGQFVALIAGQDRIELARNIAQRGQIGQRLGFHLLVVHGHLLNELLELGDLRLSLKWLEPGNPLLQAVHASSPIVAVPIHVQGFGIESFEFFRCVLVVVVEPFKLQLVMRGHLRCLWLSRRCGSGRSGWGLTGGGRLRRSLPARH